MWLKREERGGLRTVLSGSRGQRGISDIAVVFQRLSFEVDKLGAFVQEDMYNHGVVIVTCATVACTITSMLTIRRLFGRADSQKRG